jgi:polyhydroxyalkanoate synthesis regulator phasin
MNIIINIIIGFICVCVLCLVILNYYRIEKMVNEQNLYVNQSKKQIEDLNVLLMNKYEKKKELDVKILSIMNKKINSFEKFCKQNSNTNTNSITNLKKNIKKLQDTMIITDDENL